MWNDITNEELCIIYQQTKSDELYEYFLNRNIKLIFHYISPIYVKQWEPGLSDDLLQVGRIAMYKAMLMFDLTKGTKFSTIFHYVIKDELWEYGKDKKIIRLPDYAYGKAHLLQYKYPERIFTCSSLDEIIPNFNKYGVDAFLIDTVKSDTPTPEELEIENAEKEEVRKLLTKLSPKEQYLIGKYYGLIDSDRKTTFQSLGDEIGVSKERIQIIVKQGLKKLKKEYDKYEKSN